MSPIIQLSGINMLRENKAILSDVSLTINRGDFIAVTGPNGGPLCRSRTSAIAKGWNFLNIGMLMGGRILWCF